MLEVAIWAENIVMLSLGSGNSLKGGRLEYPQEYNIQRLSVRLLLLIHSPLQHIAVLDCNRQDSDYYNAM
jgi:hypothetical protein